VNRSGAAGESAAVHVNSHRETGMSKATLPMLLCLVAIAAGAALACGGIIWGD
jgi:hypothetical protein